MQTTIALFGGPLDGGWIRWPVPSWPAQLMIPTGAGRSVVYRLFQSQSDQPELFYLFCGWWPPSQYL